MIMVGNIKFHPLHVFNAFFAYLYRVGAAISESRQIESPKFAEIKRQAMFIRSTPDFYYTDVIGNSSFPKRAVHLSGNGSEDIFVTHLQNPSTRANFYVARLRNSTSRCAEVILSKI